MQSTEILPPHLIHMRMSIAAIQKRSALRRAYRMFTKIKWKMFNVSSRFEPASFRVVVQCPGCYHTTELQGGILKLSNTTYLIKTIVAVLLLLARPAFNNSSASQSKWVGIFPQWTTTTFCLAFCINPSSMMYVQNLTIFLSILSIHLNVWIRFRIRNTDEDPQSSWIRMGSNTDLDPQHRFFK